MSVLSSVDGLPKSNLKAWLVCLSAGLFFFYEFFQLNILDVINQTIRDDLHINILQLSFVSSAFLWANVLFLPPAGFLLDRYSPRYVILSALGICIIGTVGFAFSTTLVGATFFRALTGLGNAFCFLSCVVLVAQWFPPNRQAFVIGIVVTMAFLGGMTAHTPFSVLSTLYGWRNALKIDGLLGVFIWVLIFLVVKDAPWSVRMRAVPSTPKGAFSLAFFNRQTLLGALYTALLNLPIMVLCALWGVSYLMEIHHTSSAQASSIVSFILIGSIIGCPLVGFLSDRQGKRKPVMIIGAIGTLLFSLPLLMPVLSNGLLILSFFSLGLFSSTQVITFPMIAESHSEKITGTAVGIASFIVMGGAGVGQMVFGWLAGGKNNISAVASGAFQSALWMFPFAAVIALVAVCLINETYCKRQTLVGVS